MANMVKNASEIFRPILCCRVRERQRQRCGDPGSKDPHRLHTFIASVEPEYSRLDRDQLETASDALCTCQYELCCASYDHSCLALLLCDHCERCFQRRARQAERRDFANSRPQRPCRERADLSVPRPAHARPGRGSVPPDHLSITRSCVTHVLTRVRLCQIKRQLLRRRRRQHFLGRLCADR